MPEMPDVVTGEPAASEWGNKIRSRTVQRYATIADRTAQNPTPAPGELAYMDAEGSEPIRIGMFNGASWVGLGEEIYVRLDGDTMTGQLTLLDFLLTAGGTVTLPGVTVVESGLGIYRHGVQELGIASSGTEGLRMTHERFRVMAIVNDGTTANPANLQIATDGRIRVSTSAAKYKDDIADAPEIADVELRPVTYTSPGDDGDTFIGLIADDVAAADGRLGVYADGELNDYDLRGVVAVLAAKINNLEERVAELETA